MSLKPSALGYVILVTPLFNAGYCLNYYSMAGRWKGSAYSAKEPWTKSQAAYERKKMLRWHKTLAKKRNQRIKAQ